MRLLFIILVLAAAAAAYAKAPDTIYYYSITDNGTPAAYDEVIAVNTAQGIINRKSPRLWVRSKLEKNADVWQELLTEKGRWLENCRWKELNSLDEVFELGGSAIKGICVWDPEVPATVNVATTAAGVQDLVVMSPELLASYRGGLKVKLDLRGKFDGSVTGSAKNDAYRWAIDEYLKSGRCTDKYVFLYDDSWTHRSTGELRYSTGRDWIVYNRGFVFDLSVWEDELPNDEPNQPLGTDPATYKAILQALYERTNGRYFTELSGFFDFWKYSATGGKKHGDVETEWETVHLITPYNVYQNTADHNCYNRSFHRYYKPSALRQRGSKKPRLTKAENGFYICVLMADYDSATPLYAFLPKNWNDPRRGDMPLSWGINPNLVEGYPDVMSYYYETATENDYFVADASCAGYFNPNRLDEKYLPLFVKHNRKYYKMLDMDFSPMILDRKPLSEPVKDAFTAFSGKGIGHIISNYGPGKKPVGKVQEVYKNMPVINLMDALTNGDPQYLADWINIRYLTGMKADETNFLYLRIIWAPAGEVISGLEKLQKMRPELNIRVVDPYTFFYLAAKEAQ